MDHKAAANLAAKAQSSSASRLGLVDWYPPGGAKGNKSLQRIYKEKQREEKNCFIVLFGDLYTLTTAVPSISIAVHFTSPSVFDELIGVQPAGFFTNVAVP